MTEEQAAAYKAAEERIHKLMLKMQMEHARHEWRMSVSLIILVFGCGLLMLFASWDKRQPLGTIQSGADPAVPLTMPSFEARKR